MLMPTTKLVLPTTGKIPGLPPPGYCRPVVTRPVGRLTGDHPNPKPKRVGKGIFAGDNEHGATVGLRVIADDGEYRFVVRDNRKQVRKEHVWFHREVRTDAGLSNTVNDMIREWKQEDDAEEADLRKRWSTWRKERRQNEYDLVCSYVKEGLGDVFYGRAGDMSLDSPRTQVEIENMREDQGMYPSEFSGRPEWGQRDFRFWRT